MRKTKGRSKGAGTLEKRADGIFRARWTVDGRTFTRTTGTKDRREAEKRLAEYVAPFQLRNEAATLEGLAAKVAGVKAELARREDERPALALADLWNAYRTSPRRPDCGPSSLEIYRAKVERFTSWIVAHRPEAKEARDIDEATAEAFFADLARDTQPETFNGYLATLRLVWKVVRKQARWNADPFAEIQRRRGGSHRRRELTLDELRTIAGKATGEMRTLFAIGIYTGLRLGDAACLKWTNLDADRHIISVVPMKTARHSQGKPLEIPAHPALLALLAETPPDERKGYIMPGLAELYGMNKGARLSAMIQRFLDSCGIETREAMPGRKARAVSVSFHSLRHTFVSLCANAGTPLTVVQAIAGHSDPRMTEHYYHSSLAATQKAVAALPAVIAIDAEAARTDEPTDADAATLAKIRELYAALTPKGREAAAAMIAGREAEG